MVGKMDPTFTLLYVTGFLFLLVIELIGIKRKRAGDTITENWQWLDRHLPPILQWGYRVFTAGGLMWVLLHFAGPWK